MTSNHQPSTIEAAGSAFQRLSSELATDRRLGAQGASRAAELREELGRLAELQELKRRELARAEQTNQGSACRCVQLERELEELRPRLQYNFGLPPDISRMIIGRLGKARCRAAMACRGFRAAVGSAKRLGSFQHAVLAVCANGFGVEPQDNSNRGHTVVCTGDAVYSFGSGQDGRLGYQAGRQMTPRVVTSLLAEDVVAAAASCTSTLVCTAEGQAYWFGWLDDQQRVTAVPRLLGELKQVVGVAAGFSHLLAWTGSGHLYTWGQGYWGQLGHDSTQSKAAPRLVEGLAGQQVVGGDGGKSHSVVCTASGQVWTFGNGYARRSPKLVEELAGSMVVAVAANHDFTAAITEAGELYTWGLTHPVYGALGHGEGQQNTQVLLPRLVAGLAGKSVSGVSAGHDHVLAWTDSGELYSWGHGAHGRLGHNSQETEYSPRRVEALAGRQVVRAAAGHTHSVVATLDQQVYTFGEGSNGQLGHKDQATWCLPRRNWLVPTAWLRIG